MEKSQNRLILFMPSMDGGGVEKNIVIIGNYLSKHVVDLVLITFDNKFNSFFSQDLSSTLTPLPPKSNKSPNCITWVFFPIQIYLFPLFFLINLSFKKIYVETFIQRKRHIKILELFGFKKEGKLKKHYYFNNLYVDSVLHSYIKWI